MKTCGLALFILCNTSARLHLVLGSHSDNSGGSSSTSSTREVQEVEVRPKVVVDDAQPIAAVEVGGAVASHTNKSINMTAVLPIMFFGGVVFFVHVPKTGGTTIRRNLEKLDRVQYIFAKNYSTYYDEASLVEDAILNNTPNKTVLFYEIHATTAPSFFRLRQRLKRWKETARHNAVPFFVFTVLRDSVAYAFSHFSFFHIQKRNPTFEQVNATEENFLRMTLSNPQCQFLYKGEPSMRAQKAKGVVVQPEDCQKVESHLMELMDWVGTTENLSNETLPLLARLLDLPPDEAVADRWESHRMRTKEQDVYFGIENVSSSSIEAIREMSTLDIDLYNNVRKKYKYEVFL